MLSILLLVNFILCDAEWIKISQIPTSEFQMYTTESTVHISKIDDDTTPIRYEDLEHIIGPGFEDELEKFYQRHKEEMGKKQKDEKPKKLTSEKAVAYEDPWSVYDNPLHIGVLKDSISVIDVNNSEPHEKPMLNDKNRYEEYDEYDHLNATSLDATFENVTSAPVSKPKIIRYKFVKVKPKETESHSFSGFLTFLRDIQSSFVTKTARSIEDKIRLLTQFRDDLLINIGMLFVLKPSSAVSSVKFQRIV